MWRPLPPSTAYNMAKAGVNHLALTAAAELAPMGIRESAGAGLTDTPGERLHFTEQQIADGARDMPFGWHTRGVRRVAWLGWFPMKRPT
ncbi:MAG: hypothetical protein R2762_26510 [Bryobacteraceae bacterium]